ncbi:MAG: hypothetical protein EB075_14445 [Bacteroidetes bacterium]|nr:hypothetical protein [Bacteroidota bacterium]
MPDVYYDFSAMRFSADSVALCIAMGGSFLPPTPRDIDMLWEEIQHSFVQAGWARVANILDKMSYTYDALGLVAVRGTNSQAQEVFRLLTPYRTQVPGAKSAEAQFTVSVRFSRSTRCPQHLWVHHWMGCMRVVDDGGPVHPVPKLSATDQEPYRQSAPLPS